MLPCKLVSLTIVISSSDRLSSHKLSWKIIARILILIWRIPLTWQRCPVYWWITSWRKHSLFFLLCTFLEKDFSQNIFFFFVWIIIFYIIIMRLIKSAIWIVVTIRILISNSSGLTQRRIRIKTSRQISWSWHTIRLTLVILVIILTCY